MADPIIYDHTVEGLFQRSLGKRVTSSMKERLRTAGLDLDKPLRPTYAKKQWQSFVQIAAEELYPNLPREKAFHELGRQVVLGLQHTLWGRALVSVVRLLGPRRALLRIQDAFSGVGNFIQTKLTEIDKTTFEMWISDTYGRPSYIVGGVAAALELCGAKGLDISVSPLEAEAAVLRIHWSAT